MMERKRADRLKEQTREERAHRYGNEAYACPEGQCRADHDQEKEQEGFTRYFPPQRNLKQIGSGERRPGNRKADPQRPMLRCSELLQWKTLSTAILANPRIRHGSQRLDITSGILGNGQ